MLIHPGFKPGVWLASLCLLLLAQFSWADAPPPPAPNPSLDRLLSMRDSLARRTLRVARIVSSSANLERLDNRILRSLSEQYLQRIMAQLNLQFEYVDVPSPKAAVVALSEQRVDLLVRATGFENANPDILLSQAYLPINPIIVGRSQDQSQPLDLRGRQVLVLEDYLPIERVQQAYPKAQVREVSNTPEAFELLVDKQADVFIGDQLRANFYLQTRTDLHLQNKFSAHLPQTGFAFAVHRDDAVLLALLNYGLRSIPEMEKLRINQQVCHGPYPCLASENFILSAQELAWLKQHRQITVLLDDVPGYLYRNGKGEWTGLSLKLLRKLGSTFGMKIHMQASRSADDDLLQLAKGTANLSGRQFSSRYANQELHLTLPFGSRNWTFLVREGDSSPNSLEVMGGRKLALSREHPLYAHLHTLYPNIQLVRSENFRHSMSLVLNRQVDATLVSSVTTRNAPEPGLQYGWTIKATPTPHQFAVAAADKPLQSILNKLLESMSRNPQSDIQVIAERPLSNFWQWAVENAWHVGLAVLLILALSMLWNWRLKIQVKRRICAQTQLQDKLAFQFSLLNGLPTPVYVRDLEGRLTACNRAYEAFFCTAQELIEGLLPSEQSSLPKGFALGLEAEHQLLLHDHQPRFIDTTLICKGQEHHLYLWLVPFYNARGQLQGSLGGWLDITTRKQLELELREAKQEAQTASAAKSEFLASMSHELRTPLNALVGLLELETSGRTDASVNLRIAQQSAMAMIDLIGNILDLDKIESRQMQLALEPTDLAALLGNSLALFNAQAKDKGLYIRLAYQAPLQRWYALDALRVQQIVHNLLSNALRFTEQGGIELRVREEPLAGDRSLLTLSVCDTGIGIAQALQGQIFEPYRQASAQTAQCYGGSGLGLTICKQLTELMGGRIWLESVPGQGCCVHVALPLRWQLAAQLQAQVPDLPAAPSQALRVLVVDDVSTNGLVLSLQLERLGHQAKHLCSGAEALLELQKQTYDVLISDCNMPSMDGYALTRAVRAQELALAQKPHLIVGYTASALCNEASQCYDAGMDDLMIKPVTLARLHEVLSVLLATEPRELEAQADSFNLAHLLDTDQDSETIRQRILCELQVNLEQEISQFAALNLPAHPEQIDSVSHRLAGMACMIDALELAGACNALRQTIGQPATYIAAAEQALLRSLQRIQQDVHRQLDSLAEPAA
ncbi:ATP-binding protein [Pseudomonas sp. 5P_3.1_Bac2]|uniref:ATP-binding protein n=1 Tax=Pseudomonas sp. 5P_3.1_Bac2 TaxID=2971617 RepID=UPI0021CA11EB|nr:transporter substrate-binding domain-containing protein [Pseudomonas sp. 5P_3.1_Bac2]MCU1717753.1 transporter substrate-binding domain-containing protein [Pseudomonas sp. 5P_3.1_Bac2]